jgi:hypothetical protein
VEEGDVIHMEGGAESAAAQSNVRARVEATAATLSAMAMPRAGSRCSAQALEMRCEASVGDNLAEDGGRGIRWWWRRRRLVRW